MYFFLILNYVRSNEAGETEDADDNILYFLGLYSKKFDTQKIPIMRYASTDIKIASFV